MSHLRKTKGLHILIDLSGCDPHQINSKKFWNDTLIGAAQAASMEILHTHFHEFKPQGITGFLLLSTSHISIHSWPEYNYVACDVFSCSDDENTLKAADFLVKAVESTKKQIQKIKRGYNILEYLESPIYRTGETSRTRVIKKLAEIHSAFQDIVVADLKKFGKSLVIDGLVQTSEFDHERYDKAILAPLKPTDRNIIILGGGDGYVAEMALKINPDLKITIIDLDAEVVFFAKKYLNQKVFSHPNVTLNIGDAMNYLKMYANKNGEKVDGIISDLTDNPMGSRGAKNKMGEFYEEIFRLSKEILKPNGWISAQAGAAAVIPKYIDAAKIIENKFKKIFGNFNRNDVLVPSFGEKNSFIWASN
ncbi:S-adenosylmethionine decarboxylase proenzyme [Candidatus Kaiserbacteria bacterium RIFOXYD1_FULL_47_14]|uniref:S-adenosylmethionine decarboxylase proenzyme n=1 Tax=Candidatus Kaiserbacteria bacterium RIFOXYD1_FULL_47_14 TaxID=1798533 RepID=A0A1F6G753_9BACT|nr:MAG: S-adenosylmethionine decarboxylase proenzyme [Candidatus Kaiserbacteria bacterium RIFOXYD1_FULL_47_14]